MIDIHDHYRQGIIAFHLHWQTRTWWHRLFSSIYGIIITDAYFLYKLEFKQAFNGLNVDDHPNLIKIKDFCLNLSKMMIFNTFDQVGLRQHHLPIAETSLPVKSNEINQTEFIYHFSSYLIFFLFLLFLIGS